MKIGQPMNQFIFMVSMSEIITMGELCVPLRGYESRWPLALALTGWDFDDENWLNVSVLLYAILSTFWMFSFSPSKSQALQFPLFLNNVYIFIHNRYELKNKISQK